MPRFLLYPLFSVLLLAQLGCGDDGRPAVGEGWDEVVLSVLDPQEHARVLTEAGGWELVTRGTTCPGILAAWDLPSAATGREILLRNPGTERGYIRLVRFENAGEQELMRPGDNIWDGGGIFDFGVRVTDIDATAAALRGHGWSGLHGVPRQFDFGPFTVREWFPHSPRERVRFAMVQRLKPPLEGWPHLRKISRAFNSTQIVSDLAAAKDFYLNKLGFKIYLEDHGPSTSGFLPEEFDGAHRDVYIMSPRGDNEGSIEILAYRDIPGTRDFSGRTRAPNLGMLSLRFLVEDAREVAKTLRRRGVRVLGGPRRARVDPYGIGLWFMVRSPEGAQLEFFSPDRSKTS